MLAPREIGEWVVGVNILLLAAKEAPEVQRWVREITDAAAMLRRVKGSN